MLELLNETRRKLLLLDDLAFALALCAFLDVVRVVSTTPPAVRTDHSSVVGNFKVLAKVQFF